MVELALISPVFLCCLIAAVQIAFAAQVNRTIDDTYGDSATGVRPTYLPTTGGIWADATCKGCAIQPNPSLAFDGSWTASTYHPFLNEISFQFEFTGIAIYVFFIIPNTAAPGVTTQTECSFTLDGQPSGSFSHLPTASLDYIYNALVFSMTNLPNTHHVLNVSTSGLDYSVFINFDYAIYTFDDTPPSSPPSSSTPNPTLNLNSNPSGTAAIPINLQSTSQSTTSSTNPLSTASTALMQSTISNSLHAVSTSGTTSGGTPAADPPGTARASSSSSPSSTTTHSSGPGMNLIAGAAGGSAGAVVLLIAFFLLCRRLWLKNEAARSLSSTVNISTVISAYTSHPRSESPASLAGPTGGDRWSPYADGTAPDETDGAALVGTPRRLSTKLVRPSQQEDNNVTASLRIPSEYSRQLQQHPGLCNIGRLESESAIVHGTDHRQREEHKNMQTQQEQQSESSWGQYLASEAPPEYSPDPL